MSDSSVPQGKPLAKNVARSTRAGIYREAARLKKWADDWSKKTGGMSEADKGWMFAAREVRQIISDYAAPQGATTREKPETDPKVELPAVAAPCAGIMLGASVPECRRYEAGLENDLCENCGRMWSEHPVGA